MRYVAYVSDSGDKYHIGRYTSYIWDYLGVSENSVPLNPMVLLIIIPMKNGYFIGNIPHFQTYPFLKFLGKPHRATPFFITRGCRQHIGRSSTSPWHAWRAWLATTHRATTTPQLLEERSIHTLVATVRTCGVDMIWSNLV